MTHAELQKKKRGRLHKSRAAKTHTRLSQLRRHRLGVPQQHNSTAATSTKREISTEAKEVHIKKRIAKIKIVQPLFVFTLYFSCADNRKEFTRGNPSKQSKRGKKKLLNYRTKCRNTARGRRPEATAAWAQQATVFERQQK